MTVDTSAMVAIIRRETDAVRLTRALADASVTGVGAPTLLEAGMVLCGRVGEIGQQLLDQFVRDRHLIVIPFTAEHWAIAVRGFLRFGKGRHPAALNLGDCLTYAVAKLAGEPLLCLGNDFPHTDLELVRV